MTATTLKIKTDTQVAEKLDTYPAHVKPLIEFLRNLIIKTAEECEAITAIEETLKWGELSYLTKKGSTIRIDWKTKTPNQYAIYFKCTSKLVATFREVYGDTFNYENNRAILFSLTEDIPEKELKECIKMALTYHSVKHLKRLGSEEILVSVNKIML